MEIEAEVKSREYLPDDAEDQTGMSKMMIGKLLNSIPGIDEAMAYAEVMRLVKSMKYNKVIFDTAPTGHTLRLLDFPNVLVKALGKLIEIRDMFGPMIESVGQMLKSGMDFKKMY